MWAQQAKLGTSAVNHATVIKMRAERRLADAVDEGQKQGQIATKGKPVNVRPPDIKAPPAPPTLGDIGVDRRRLDEARKIRDNYTDDDLIDLQRQADEADELLSRKDLVTRPRGKLISQSGGSRLAIGAVNAAGRLKTDAEWEGGRLLRQAQERSEFIGRGKSVDVSDFSQRQLHRWQDMSRVDRALVHAAAAHRSAARPRCQPLARRHPPASHATIVSLRS